MFQFAWWVEIDRLYYEIDVYITYKQLGIATTQQPSWCYYVEIYDLLFHGGDALIAKKLEL